MKKIWLMILGAVVSALLIYTAGINFVNIVYYKRMEWTLDYGLLFFNGQKVWFSFLTIVWAVVWTDIILKQLRYDSKRGLSKEEKMSISKPLTERFLKNYLVRLDFNEDSFKYPKFQTKKLQWKIKWYKKTKTMEEKIRTVFHVQKSKDVPFLTKFNQHHPNPKLYTVDGKNTYYRAGLPVITYKKHAWVQADDYHTLIIGTSGSGKSWSVSLGYLEMCRMSGENVLVNDPKGELTKAVKGKFERDGYNCIVLNFVDPAFSNCWNPLSKGVNEWEKSDQKYDEEMRIWEEKNKGIIEKCKMDGMNLPQYILDTKPRPDYSSAIEMLTDVANTLTNEENAKDKVWTETARDMIVGACCYFLEKRLYKMVNFANIKSLIQDGGEDSEFPKGDFNYKKLEIYLEKEQERCIKENLFLNSYDKLKGYLGSLDNTKSSFDSTFQNKMSPVTQNEAIARVLANNQIDFEKIGEQKTAIFLVVHDEKKTYYPLATLFIKQCYEALIGVSRYYDGGRLKIPMNMLLDEFGNLPAIPDIDSMLTAARSRGVRLTLILQDYGQLDKGYGKDMAKTIKGNVMNTLYLLSGDEDTLEDISKRAGNTKRYNKDMKKWEDVPIFSKDRLRNFQMSECLFIFQRLGAFFTRLNPYSSYVFFDKNTLDSPMDVVEKPYIDRYHFNMDYRIFERDQKYKNR